METKNTLLMETSDSLPLETSDGAPIATSETLPAETQQTETKKGRGGARFGAGRKNLREKYIGLRDFEKFVIKDGEKVKRRSRQDSKLVSFRVPHWAIKEYIVYKGGSDFLRELLLEALNSKRYRGDFDSWVNYHMRGDKINKDDVKRLLDVAKEELKEKRAKIREQYK